MSCWRFAPRNGSIINSMRCTATAIVTGCRRDLIRGTGINRRRHADTAVTAIITEIMGMKRTRIAAVLHVRTIVLNIESDTLLGIDMLEIGLERAALPMPGEAVIHDALPKRHGIGSAVEDHWVDVDSQRPDVKVYATIN